MNKLGYYENEQTDLEKKQLIEIKINIINIYPLKNTGSIHERIETDTGKPTTGNVTEGSPTEGYFIETSVQCY